MDEEDVEVKGSENGQLKETWASVMPLAIARRSSAATSIRTFSLQMVSCGVNRSGTLCSAGHRPKHLRRPNRNARSKMYSTQPILFLFGRLTTSNSLCIGENCVESVEKKCGYNGRWEGQNGTNNEEYSHGWANYTTCLTPEMLRLHGKVYTNTVEGNMKLDIAEKTRTLEFVGLSISLVALLASLAIFCRFRSLRNTRTRIHKNLFVAMVVQVLIRLTLYIDIEVLRRKTYGIQHGIGNTPVLCEASYALLEYTKTAMFMWMFIEGLFLHNMVTVTVFQENSYYRMYRFIGWGCPVIMTLVWAIITAFYYHPKSKFTRCWSGYNLSSYFWILEGPRFAVILLNFLFLLNIVRVLVVKLRQSHTSEIEQVLKAVRAAVVLLPLLGITNVLFMIEVPLHNVKKFALWSYSTHFLQSFQGLFIATLYCFLNGEVRLALDKTISVYLSLRGTDLQARRQSTFSGCQPQRIASVIEMEEEEMRPSGWIRLCCRGGNTPPPDRPAEWPQ